MSFRQKKPKYLLNKRFNAYVKPKWLVLPIVAMGSMAQLCSARHKLQDRTQDTRPSVWRIYESVYILLWAERFLSQKEVSDLDY